MKKIVRIFFLTALSVGILNFAEAQRGRDSRGAGGGNSERVSRSPEPSRSFSPPTRNMAQRSATVNPQRSEQVRTFDRNRNNNATYNNNNAMRNATRGGNNARITPQRNTTVYNTRNTVVARNGYSGSAYRGYNNNHINSSNYRYQSYYGNVYGRRTGFMYGTRYRFIPHSFISLRFGGYPYYYNNGFYYGYYGGYYQPIFPPFGLQLGMLPYGYSSFYWGGNPYYYYNGIYYTNNYGDDGGYQVVDAPMGATVSSLPGGATSVVVNGEVLYELNGTYYKAGQDANGNNVFTVIGKNGVVNNTPSVQNQTTQPPSSDMQPQSNMQYPSSDNAQAAAPSQLNQATPSSSHLSVGDTVSQLPDGSRLITINGEQLYETPDNVYMKGELNNGVVQFKVVGK